MKIHDNFYLAPLDPKPYSYTLKDDGTADLGIIPQKSGDIQVPKTMGVTHEWF